MEVGAKNCSIWHADSVHNLLTKGGLSVPQSHFGDTVTKKRNRLAFSKASDLTWGKINLHLRQFKLKAQMGEAYFEYKPPTIEAL